MKQIEESGSAVDEALDARLGEVHQQLAVIGASSAEAKARRILFGLGFTAEMQVRATKFFSGTQSFNLHPQLFQICVIYHIYNVLYS